MDAISEVEGWGNYAKIAFEKGYLLYYSYSKRKDSAPFEGDFFPPAVDPFSERTRCTGKQTEIYRSSTLLPEWDYS